MNKHKHYQAPWLRYVMSCVLSVLVVALMIAVPGCAQKESPAELGIPAHFTTYTDEAGLFSISYPPDWEPALSQMEALEQATKELLESIEADVPLEQASMIFSCELTSAGELDAGMNITVESLPGFGWTLDEVVEAGTQMAKDMFEEYHEFSRLKTTIGGREAVIVDWEGSFTGLPRMRNLQMTVLADKVAWYLTCSAIPEKFNDFEDDFYAIVRSLRILK